MTERSLALQSPGGSLVAFLQGPLANRPAAPADVTIYEDDTGGQYLWNGFAWSTLGGGSPAPAAPVFIGMTPVQGPSGSSFVTFLGVVLDQYEAPIPCRLNVLVTADSNDLLGYALYVGSLVQKSPPGPTAPAGQRMIMFTFDTDAQGQYELRVDWLAGTTVSCNAWVGAAATGAQAVTQ